MNDQEKAKHLCDLKICASMGEARRIIMQGAYDHYINKQTKWGRKKTQIKLTWPENSLKVAHI